MSEFISQTRSAVVLPTVSLVKKDTAKHETYKNKQSVKLPDLVSSTVHYDRLQHLQQQQFDLKQWRLLRQMQYRLLIVVCLMLGLSLTAFVLGVFNLLALHSLQEEVNQYNH